MSLSDVVHAVQLDRDPFQDLRSGQNKALGKWQAHTMHTVALAQHNTLHMRAYSSESTGDALLGNRRPLASADRGGRKVILSVPRIG